MVELNPAYKSRYFTVAYQKRLEGHVDIPAAKLPVVGLAPGVDASALAETGAVLESGDDFDGPLVVVEENGFGRVEMDVLEVRAALAVAIVAVRVDVV